MEHNSSSSGLSSDDVESAYRFVTQVQNKNANRETFEKRIHPLYEALVETAKAGETITYSELAAAADTDRRNYTSKLLDGISHIEEQHDRPALSVLVVNAHTNQPSRAFMEIVNRYSLRDRYDVKGDEAIIKAITNTVHKEWSN